MALTPEQFERIYDKELTPIQRRILRRILKGETNEKIRGDVTVWFDREVYEGKTSHTLREYLN